MVPKTRLTKPSIATYCRAAEFCCGSARCSCCRQWRDSICITPASVPRRLRRSWWRHASACQLPSEAVCRSRHFGCGHAAWWDRRSFSVVCHPASDHARIRSAISAARSHTIQCSASGTISHRDPGIKRCNRSACAGGKCRSRAAQSSSVGQVIRR
jgi:hypothetical protein